MGQEDHGKRHAQISRASDPAMMSRIREDASLAPSLLAHTESRCGQNTRRASHTRRRRDATRMPTPTRFITTIVAVILNANVATLATAMIGNTESTMYK